MAGFSGGESSDRPQACSCGSGRRRVWRARPAVRRGKALAWPLAAGLLLLAAVAGARSGGPAAVAPPAARSLAPLEVEAFRQRWGQEALFRLRLGVEASRDDGSPCPAAVLAWSGSPQQRRFEAELVAGRPYAAGQWLGAWQRQQQRCGVGSARGSGSGSGSGAAGAEPRR